VPRAKGIAHHFCPAKAGGVGAWPACGSPEVRWRRWQLWIQSASRSAQLSTGPVTEEGKKRSRQNAVRHGLTAETVIDALEDAEDYAAFEMAVTADYDAQSAVERELVLRLASVLWRLRRANSIESGLFKIQARQLLQFRQQRRAPRARHTILNGIYRHAAPAEGDMEQADTGWTEDEAMDAGSPSIPHIADPSDDLTRTFVRLSNLPTFPLDRLSRYEAALWRQACQLLFTLQCLGRCKPWKRLRPR
jgi:hypothetical protein